MRHQREETDASMRTNALGRSVKHGPDLDSADTAMRLVRFLRMSPEFWMGLQSDYEMALACDQLTEELKSIRPFRPALVA